MLNRKLTAKGFPCKQENCYASRHLDGPDYKIWDIMKAAAPRKDGQRLFYAPIEPWLCNAANQSPSTVRSTLERLEKAGWIICVEKARYRKDGTKTSNVFRVLEHDEYVALHPRSSCPDYKLAPDSETAAKYGVEKGDRVPTGRTPWNFLKDVPAPPSATRDAIVEWMAGLTAADREQVIEHFKTAVSGQPEEVEPTPVDRNPLRPAGDVTSSGRPELPAPVDRSNRRRPTGENPILIRTTPPDNTTTEQNRGDVVVVRDAAARPAMVVNGRKRLMKVFIELEKEAPNLTTAQEKQIDDLIERDGVQMAEKILRRDLEDNAFTTVKGVRTMYPLARFLKRYELLKMEIEARKPSASLSKERKEKFDRIALIRHSFMWYGQDLDEREHAFVKSMIDRQSDTWTDNEIDRALAMFRAAEYRNEDKPKKLEPKNDDEPPF